MTQDMLAFECIRNAGDVGKTTDEIGDALNVTAAQARCYVTRLLNAGTIKPRDKKRTGKARRCVTVYVTSGASSLATASVFAQPMIVNVKNKQRNSFIYYFHSFSSSQPKAG